MKLTKDLQPKIPVKPEIDINNYKAIKELQSGTNSSIFSVKNIKTEKFFAAKIIKNDDQDEKIQRVFNFNFNNIIDCQHPTLLKYFGYSTVDFKGDKNKTIIMDLATNCSLSSFIEKAQNGISNRYYKNARQIILVGICRGMMYLHKHHLLHRNLNTSNIFLDEHYRPLIANYSLSKFSKSGQVIPQNLTYQNAIYMAPEVLSNNTYTIKSDVYSFGIMMYEILTDSTPYPLFQKGRMTTLQFVRKVINEDYRPKYATPLRKSFKKLIERCLSKNPQNRPSFEDIFNMLAYNIEDAVFEVTEEKEKDENDHNYYLDGIDFDELFTYIKMISKSDKQESNESLKISIDELKRNNELLMKDNEQLRQQIGILKKQNMQLAKKFEESYTKEIEPIRNYYEQLKKDNEELKKENEEIKKKQEEQETELPLQRQKRPEIPPLVLQKREEKPVVIEVEEEDDYNSNSLSENISTITFDSTIDSTSKFITTSTSTSTINSKKKKKERSSSSSSDSAEIERKKANARKNKLQSNSESNSSDTEEERKTKSLQTKSRLQTTMPAVIKKKKAISSSSSDSENDKKVIPKGRRNSLKSRKDSLSLTLRRIESKSDNEDSRDIYPPGYSNKSFHFPLHANGKTSDNDDDDDEQVDRNVKNQKERAKIPIKKNERSSINEREFYYLRKNRASDNDDEQQQTQPTQKKNEAGLNSPSNKTEERKQNPTQKTNTIRLNSPSRKLNYTLRKSADEDKFNSDKPVEAQRKFFSPRYKPELLHHLAAKKSRDSDEKLNKDSQSPSASPTASSKPTPLIKKFEKSTNDDDRGLCSPRKKNEIYNQQDERGPSSPRKRIDEERGLSSPRKKIEKSNEDDRTLNSPRNKDTKLNPPRYKTEQTIRLPKKVESPKDEDEKELLSPRKRAESLRVINKNELNYDNEDDPVLNSPRYKPPAFNETNIALDRFNGLPLKFQKSFVSELIKKSPNKLNQDLNLIKELLRYLLQFNQSINSIHYFSVSTNRPKESYANVNEWCQDINEVHLLSAATEILYLNNSLDSTDFIEIIKQFGSVSIEIKYPSENFAGTFEIASNIKNLQITKLKLAISISGISTVDEMFRKNKDINSVKLDSTVTSIGKNSFRSCSSLVYVSISSTIKSIGNDSFRKCSSLTQITIPTSVTSIGEGAFSKCNALRTITIPSSVTYIGEWAFNECTNLKQINLPDSVAQIGEWAFSGCSALKNLVLPKSISVIGVSTFADCASLTKIVIPSSVTSIGNWAFCKCSSLTDVSIPSSVVSIGEGAFSKCFALTDVEIPPKVTIIRTSTFAECSSLELVSVPPSVTTIEDQAFAGCFSLNEVRLPRSVASIGFWAFPSNTVITSLA